MARLARLVVPGVPHHVTQRGNDRQDVFFADGDRRMYLRILGDHARQQDFRILAWCLMPNHVHIVGVPARDNSLALACGRTHYEYARWLHVRLRRTGHLWQNRFYSCPLEGRHLWEAVRYVELNPVRGRLVEAPEDWRWSSARAHLGGDEWNLVDMPLWREQWNRETWRAALRSGLSEAAFEARLREATRTGRPLGASAFVEQLERETGRPLRPRKRGPEPKGASGQTGRMSLGVM